MSTSTESIFTRFWDWVTGEAKQIPTIENTIMTFADKVVNDLKSIQSSAVAQYIETGIASVAEVIDPALTPLISGIENYIPKVIGLVTGVVSTAQTEVDKPVSAQIADGLAALEKIKGLDTAVYTGLLGTIQTAISNYVLTNNAVTTGVVAPTAGTLLAIGQVVHTQAAA